MHNIKIVKNVIMVEIDQAATMSSGKKLQVKSKKRLKKGKLENCHQKPVLRIAYSNQKATPNIISVNSFFLEITAII
jgi:hypothetical protein